MIAPDNGLPDMTMKWHQKYYPALRLDPMGVQSKSLLKE